jgi:hypothetical protein
MSKRTIEIGRTPLPDQGQQRFRVFVDDVLVGEIDGENGEAVSLPDRPWKHMRLVRVNP